MDCGIDGLTFTRPSLVKSQFAADCDLSNIVRKFIRTGELPQQRMRPNIGSDAAYPVDYQALQDTLAAARSNFELLPQDERDKFASVEDWLEFKAAEEKPSAEEKPPAEEKTPAEGQQ